MRKRFRILLVALVFTGAAIVVWAIWGSKAPAEPVYQGRALSVWLDDYVLISHGISEEENKLMEKANHEVDEVVRHIGTNVIPTLFRMLSAKDSPLRKLETLARDRGWHDFKFKSAPALRQNIQAAKAFRALGAEAKDAVPRLVAMYNRSQDKDSHSLIAYALGGIGPLASNAVPSLLRTVTNAGSTGVLANAFRALGEIHAYPERVVPVLIKSVRDPDVNMRWSSIEALEAYGAEADPPFRC